MATPNPMSPPDPFANPYLPNMEQMEFIYIHYPAHAGAPVDMLMWLYNFAALNEMEAKEKKERANKVGKN